MRRGCYFYEEKRYKGLHEPTCRYYARLGYCPCSGCTKFIDNEAVFNAVKSHVDDIGTWITYRYLTKGKEVECSDVDVES